MKKLLVLSIALSMVMSCSPAPDNREHDWTWDTPEQKDTTSTLPEEPKDSVLCAPRNLQYTFENGQLEVSWEDCCAVEEGYLVTRTLAGKAEKHFLKRNSTSYSETLTLAGLYLYEVCSYSGTDRSEAVSFEIGSIALPKVEFSMSETSHYEAVFALRLVEDGGQKCEVGIEYEGGSITLATNKAAGAELLASLEDLEYGQTYEVRPWARNDGGISYGDSYRASLKAAPTALAVSWTEVKSDLPGGVKVYKSSTSIDGANVNMWYAIADMSTAEVRTTIASSLETPSAHVTGTLAASCDVAVCVNGGYFGAPNTSYSHVTDRGSRKAKNIASLTRTKNYYVTRGAFGIDSDGKPEVYWIYDDNSSTRAYEKPLPVIDGAEALTPSASYPSPAIDWKPYNAIGGAPVLLRDGRICFDFLKTPDGKYFSNHDLLQTDIFADGLKAPRTAIGATSDGKIILFICDGRNSGGSAGLTLTDEARVLLGLGCTDALNLDGGGSTAMVVGNSAELLNKPSDGSQRKVLSFVSFVSK